MSEELYHYGIKGMKWKKQTSSASVTGKTTPTNGKYEYEVGGKAVSEEEYNENQKAGTAKALRTAIGESYRKATGSQTKADKLKEAKAKAKKIKPGGIKALQKKLNSFKGS
jgi:hypothetical protein